MAVFLSTLDQMGFLFLIILIGYILNKTKATPDCTASILSKLENNVFIPALVMGTLMTDFTVKKLSASWQYLVGGTVVTAVSIVLAIVFSRIIVKDKYTQNIFTYGLTFSNFGFMGNAVVKALFPEVFPFYLILTIPLWIAIYVWGVPSLLMPENGEKRGLLSNLRKMINPMFISMLIGMILGISGVVKYLPDFTVSAVNTLGNCMSPVAMLLTGMTVAEIGLGKAFSKVSVYVVSVIRLVVMPMIFMIPLVFLPIPKSVSLCMICSVAMPLGLNTIVIPKAYDLDCSTASSMALVSHIMSCGTIPLIFMLFELLI
ncbi:MAG: AEC family transporter [Clostridia bacterium]|nr:AEC family transporter [Clostridia bacterium]